MRWDALVSAKLSRRSTSCPMLSLALKSTSYPNNGARIFILPILRLQMLEQLDCVTYRRSVPDRGLGKEVFLRIVDPQLTKRITMSGCFVGTGNRSFSNWHIAEPASKRNGFSGGLKRPWPRMLTSCLTYLHTVHRYRQSEGLCAHVECYWLPATKNSTWNYQNPPKRADVVNEWS